MKFISSILLFFFIFQTSFAQDYSGKITLVIHGGAGTITRANMTPEKEKAYREVLNIALQKGYAVLKQGGTSEKAVEAAIMVMEDSPLFNAGKGAVFTNEGKNEMDAAIMDGKTLKAGAIAGVTTIKNPIRGAIAVMEKSPHVLMAGKGADLFAKEQGLEIVDPSYFYTEARYKALLKAKEEEKIELDHTENIKKEIQKKPKTGFVKDEDLIFTEGKKYGTVGCVALDKFGNLTAGTSTGGMTNKRYGRIGDAPIIGAGTYANNNTCAVSATGHGEFFIRSVVAYDISALMDYKGMSVKDAADEVVMKKLVERGGEGGVIALDRNGNFAMPFNSEGMYRGYIKADGKSEVMIYKDEVKK
ncbi:isoaspartyl peptidase/L-asparaginase family protein [Dyadobacter frigoris]|uniref:Isoaspartyl peptidase n=1 Tax=Dyadobacter frigoris TaxID=2576211 RepID=A0A4U6D9Z3_9BACT|nr:isoaspartyl peptidase/L-asparaginase [Dyadobacter frigoris]TKT93505.1 isoaspartyl peptidase/L-asparaginase [Dyadobacter frigoris]GLU55765.1 isoaspartyl peptidase/L-asparaginase [Dyadobacter frigoris]